MYLQESLKFYTSRFSGVLILVKSVSVVLVLMTGISLNGMGKGASRLQAPAFPTPEQRIAFGKADYDWSVWTLDGKELALSSFRGEVVLLNFWATWCGPCVAEMTGLQRLYDSLNRQVVFLMITNEDEKTVRYFRDKRRIRLPLYVCRGEPPVVFRPRGLPTTFIVDRGGTIVLKHMGAANWDDEACRGFVRALLE